MIGLSKGEIQSKIIVGLSGANINNLDRFAHVLADNVARAIEENNKKLERDIEYMIKPPSIRRF